MSKLVALRFVVLWTLDRYFFCMCLFSTKQYSEVPREVLYLCFNTSTSQRNLHFQVTAKHLTWVFSCKIWLMLFDKIAGNVNHGEIPLLWICLWAVYMCGQHVFAFYLNSNTCWVSSIQKATFWAELFLVLYRTISHFNVTGMGARTLLQYSLL